MKQVQQIDNILAGMNSASEKPMQESRELQSISRDSSALALRQKYGSVGNFLVKCNPSFQSYYTDKPIMAFRHDAPSLGLLRYTFGDNAPVSWLYAEIQTVSEFCGCRDKLSDEQMDETALLISTAYPWLKVTELLLFFGWFKLGRYGKFYGCLDPMVITTSLQDFLVERSNYLSKIEQQERERKEEEDRKIPRCTYAEWLEKKKQREKMEE